MFQTFRIGEGQKTDSQRLKVKQSEDCGKKLLSEVDIRKLVNEYNVMLKKKEIAR